MIKELIEDLTFDKTTLTQALTRAKVIAYKINNSDFKNWIQAEINGYKNVELPDYRTIKCSIFAEIFDPLNGGTRTIPMDVSNLERDLETKYSFYEMRITQSIGTLETGIKKDKKSDYGYEYLNQGLARSLAEMSPDGAAITAIKRRIQLSEIDYIVEQTKQRLLDTLLELNEAFPDFDNSFSNKEKNSSDKVQTIINQHIYGNYANSNIGVGKNVSQNLNNQNNIHELRKKLENLGIEKKDIDELENTIRNEPKETVGKKILNWVGKIASKAIEKGLELQIPNLIETINHYI
ncbi:AbiTii domain-containing protein [Elizabethkingia ursingii]